MARIDALPSLEIIRGLKGILDFYYWKGLPCVRAWPKYRPAKQTAASLAAALFFGAVVKSYSLLGDAPLQAYREDARDQPRTARDIFVSGVYGNLHEASMSNFLDLLVECRDFLSDLTALLNALDSISADEIDVNVERSILPTGAATAAAQATQLTALQKLDDLQNALESKALDRLLVRGMDQLFNFYGVLAHSRDGTISGAGGFYDSFPCPAGQIWVITNILTLDYTSPTTTHLYKTHHNGLDIDFHRDYAGFAAGISSNWGGFVYLDHEDTIRITFPGALAGDHCYVRCTGFRMSVES